MFGLNQSQNSLSNQSGRVMRMAKNSDGDLIRSLLMLSSENVTLIANRIRNEVKSYVNKWRLESAISHETYFENNHGFKETEGKQQKGFQQPILMITPIVRQPYSSPMYSFMLRNVSSPYTQAVRGFKTKSSRETQSLFNRKHVLGKIGDDGVGFAGLSAKEKDKAADIEELKKVLETSGLSDEEKTRIQNVIASYTSGFEKGHNAGVSAAVKKMTYSKWNILGTIVIVGAFAFLLFGRGGMLPVGMNVQEVVPEDIEVTFTDVKGCDEAKKELEEIVEFLMNPDKFSALGGKLPKGVLLSGPPGTGKTLLARAVAGQANVPFFHAAGPEFDEVLVGQGARRVRELFRAAKARAPCVIFIDEIDSVGSTRTSSSLHPYANQTINQLLSEMDGFKANEGVIVIGATNRTSDLDKALLRPGRFDTQVTVGLPDVKGRTEIIELYLDKIKASTEIDVDNIAKRTSGFSGADVQNLVNTAAIRAAVEGKDFVTMDDFEFAYDKQTMGVDLKSRVRDMEDKKITAYHEAGHTLVAYYTKEAMPIHKVTIIAKGPSGGHTAFVPKNDQWHQTRSQLLAQMDVAFGGRAAEELIFGKDKVTGGASSDLSSASNISEAMIKELGMSEKLGLRVYSERSLANGLVGDSIKGVIDDEVNVLLNEGYKRAMAILKNHRKELDLLAEALLQHETLDGAEVKSIVEGRPLKKVPKTASNSDLKFTSKKLEPPTAGSGVVIGDPLVQCKV